MDPRKLPFNALIVGPTNSGKTQYLLNQLRGPFRGKFDYIVLFCPTFVKNKTYEGFVDRDPHIFVIACLQHEIETELRVASYFFAGTNTLFILDDCAASKDVKDRTGQLVNLGFSARHDGISVRVLTQQITSIAKPYRDNIAAIVLFYTPSSKTTKAIFEDYAGELTHEEYKELIAKLNNCDTHMGSRTTPSWSEHMKHTYIYNGHAHQPAQAHCALSALGQASHPDP